MTGAVSPDAALALAREALEHWGGARDEPCFVKLRENLVFDVTLTDGTRAALRLHRPGYQSRAAIGAELDWTGRLAVAGLRVPRPVPTRSGSFTAEAGGRVASAVSWLEGTALGAAGEPLGGTASDQARTMRALGALLARLHSATDRLELPDGFPRPAWDEEGLLGEAPLWGRFWENPALSMTERGILAEARDKARNELEAFRIEGADFGLIHADVLRENVLSGPSGLSLIDFDDSGHGFRMYDLGTALVQNLEETALPQLAAALIAGYRAERPLPEHAARRLPLFTALRAFASAGWIVTRMPPGDPRQRFYAERALRMARIVLERGPDWDPDWELEP
ncbi:phosphotransferase enzyme family protein [Ostreiculturibacter nitratireducens]|uniref:phosphotransferase enzyme family protein n=1 Tax=Ostreiculturibacter nitratireducens TaxID=3075226 RepID=UPI0031B5A551